MDKIFDLFFADLAEYPISRYQTETIHDKDIKVTPWNGNKDNATVSTRTIEFWHPIKSNVGPSGAQTTRQQTCQRFGSLGFIIENTTKVKGIPAADCFQVKDRWVFEKASTERNSDPAEVSSISMTVSFHISFTKRTMLKPIIEKNIRHETKAWFEGYLKMVQKALAGNTIQGGINNSTSSFTGADGNELDIESRYYAAGEGETKAPEKGATAVYSGKKLLVAVFLTFALLMIMIIFLVLEQTSRIQTSLKTLEGDLASMKHQNEHLMEELQRLTLLVVDQQQGNNHHTAARATTS